LAAFAQINSTNATEGAVLNFVDNNFRGEGLELKAEALPNFNPDPPFLSSVTDPLLKAFSKIVHDYWPQLIRGTNSSSLCDGKACVSTLIPLNHTFVVPGGRFREQCDCFSTLVFIPVPMTAHWHRLLGQLLDNAGLDSIPAI
jgi:alpha,alpha-trehalase